MFECREAQCASRHFFFLIAGQPAVDKRLARLLTRAKIGTRHRIRFRIRCGSLGQRA